MLTDTLKSFPTFLRGFGKNQGLKQLESQLAAHPRIYLTALTPLALSGYLLLLLFPLSSVLLIGQIVSSWTLQNSLSMPIATLIQFLAGIAALGFSLPLFNLHFKTPEGQTLDNNNIPALAKIIAELCQRYHITRIENIILDNSADIRIINSSKLAWPFKGKHTIIIGIQTLLCYSPAQFHAMLARRIGQASGRDHFLLLWLNSLNKTWQQYDTALNQASLLALPLAMLFRLYSRLLQMASQFAHQLYELAGDRYALDVTNDQDMAELFSQTIITENFLQTKYWPKIKELKQRTLAADYLPYTNMSKVIRNGLLPKDIQNCLKQAWHYPDARLQQPSLLTRLHNIGYEKPRPPGRLSKSAGTQFLSKAIFTQIIEDFDSRWEKNKQSH
ncbi:hypothetical protein MNBD_GAMMA25-743 [hydrothermal vent metagenome]|uniref:Peptidase M48 domain-containing protein n=1 Tax=hydrothermal vent metagenome TaxID=652676 RepID=A0A3B1B6L1_9ZZZZ